jgi:hypothetical protein
MYKDSQFTTTAPSVHATTDGDTVGQMYEPFSGLELVASSTSNAPTLRSDGTRNNSLLFTGGNRNLKCINSKSAFRFIHIDQDATIVFWVKMVNALASTTEIIVDTNSASAGSNSNGFSIYRNPSEQIGLTLSKGIAPASLGLNGPVINDTNWHYVVVRIKQGSGQSYIQIDGGTPTTGTISGASSPGADFLYDMQFGLGGASSAPGSFYIDNFAIVPGAISSQDLSDFLAFNPARTSVSLAVPADAGNSLDPDDVPFLHSWHKLTDLSTLFQNDGTTPVASDDDPVGLVKDKKPTNLSSDWKRTLSQATVEKCPLWQSDQVNGYGAPVWSGTAHATGDTDYDGENTLAIASWPNGSLTWIAAFKQTQTVLGSHIVARSGSEYGVQTGSGYQESTRGDFVVHFGGGVDAAETIMVPEPESPLIVVLRQDGNLAQLALNNNWGPLNTSAVRFSPSQMGRTFKPIEPGTSSTWDFHGSIFENILYTAWLDDDTITKLVRTLADRYAIAGVSKIYKPLFIALQGEQI